MGETSLNFSVANSAWAGPRTLVLGICLLAAAGCQRSAPPVRVVPVQPAPIEDLSFLQHQEVGNPITDHPWIAHVRAVDLDQDGRMDILACEAKDNQLLWLRQVAPGKFEEHVLCSDLPGIVHVEAADMTGSGHLDLIVSCMGVVFPNNDKIGSIVILENDGHQHFTKHVIADHIARVTDVRAGDFNHDGRPDLAVGQFGYDQGEIQWMENVGNWQFKSHHLLDLSGTINVCVADLGGHGALDIVAVVSQQWEEIYLFQNDGRGNFTTKLLWGSTNEDYGSSGISLCDLNRDGRPDILYTNGDGFGPAVVPGPRPWHGVQWLENLGHGNFKYHRIGDLPGAYSPVGVDLDGDGHMDVVAASAYAGWDKSNPKVVSLMWFRNDGQMNFTPHILAYTPKDLITLDAADLDGSGRPVLITGGFYVSPPYVRMGRITVWRRPPGP
ncbi:MAG: VCBS repeat-containing protein [Opitutaceae bacterium]